MDCTSRGIGRDAAGLLDIARRTGLNIIAGCGYYTQDTHPSEMPAWPADRIADEMLRELTDGIGETGVRAGVIGEIGTSSPIHPDEAMDLRAAATAWRQAPVALYVHTYPWGGHGLDAARLLTDGGVDPARIVICHGDVELDAAYLRRLLELGVCIEFDNFGKEFEPDPQPGGFAAGAFASRRRRRVRAILELLEAGHESRLLITNDICLKCMLHAYGGRGYDYVLTGVVPALKAAGVLAGHVGRIPHRQPAPSAGRRKSGDATMATVRDRLWIWGHEANSFTAFKAPPSRITPTEACHYMGIPNCIMVVFADKPEPPFDQHALAMSTLDRVVWSVIGDAGSRRNDKQSDLQAVLDVAAKYPNIKGAILDDFFRHGNPWGTPRYTVEQFAALQKGLHAGGLDLWVVLYQAELANPIQGYLDLCDVITLLDADEDRDGPPGGRFRQVRERHQGQAPRPRNLHGQGRELHRRAGRTSASWACAG